MAKQSDPTGLTRLAYKPVGLVAGSIGGLLARAMFRQAWRRLGRQGDVPKPTDADRGFAEVVLSAAAQGAVFGAVKSAVDRAGAEGFASATGVWPGRRRTRAG
jgi:hypothetical protein